MRVISLTSTSYELSKAVECATSDANDFMAELKSGEVFSVQAQTITYYEPMDHDADAQMFAHTITIVYENA
jgi:hypothetical protein